MTLFDAIKFRLTKLESSNIITTDMLTRKEEDYLETIYRLSQELDSVGISDIARERGVTLPTVFSAVSRLKANGMISQSPYGKISLNPEGQTTAEEIYESHRVLRKFLQEVLGLPSEMAEENACRMEHGLNGEAVRRLKMFIEMVQNCLNKENSCMDQFYGKVKS